MNEHDRKEVMNLIKLKRIMKTTKLDHFADIGKKGENNERTSESSFTLCRRAKI